MLKPCYFVLDPEFLALEFGDFGVRRGRVVYRFRKCGLKGPVLGVKLAKMRLKTHAILHFRVYGLALMMTQSWGLVEPLQRALVKIGTINS